MDCDEYTDPEAKRICRYVEHVLEDLEESESITPKMSKKLREMFGYNIRADGTVRITPETIIFTSKGTYDSWLYYAGFEYVPEECVNIIDVDGEFLAEFDSACSERVENVLVELRRAEYA